jgi:phosphosulfolactate synthase (CoM biosynthesis protein A)
LVLPFVIITLYWIKIRHRRPLPDLKDEMTIEDVEYIYKSVDIEQIRMRAYTKSKHAKFLRTYGILVENINLAEMGKAKTILIGLLSFV